MNTKVVTPKPTKTVSVHFKTDERVLKPSIYYKIELPKEESPQLFKAKEAPDFSKMFFYPKPASPRKSIDFSEFTFLTAQRKQKREELDNLLQKRLKNEEDREK